MRFYLFDRVVEFSPGVRATGIKNVSAQEEFLIDHYERMPVMPAPLVIESLAQLGGWLITVSSQYAYLAVMGMLKGVTVAGHAVPGDQIHLQVAIEHLSEYGAAVSCEARVQQNPILMISGITYALYQIPEKDQPAVRQKYTALQNL